MGLDMRLLAQKYVSEFNEPQYASIGGTFKQPPPGPIFEVTTEAMSWRKANAIHAWFVKNVQGGVDECQRVPVSREQLQCLHHDCIAVTANHSLAGTLLPPVDGFFFGSLEQDWYFFKTVADTADRIGELLSGKYDSWHFYYEGSW